MRGRKIYIIFIILILNINLFSNSTYTVKGFVYLKNKISPINNYPVKIYPILSDTTKNYTVYTNENGFFYFTFSKNQSDSILIIINNYDNGVYNPVKDTINANNLDNPRSYFIIPKILNKYIVKGIVYNSLDSSALENIDVFVCSEGTSGLCRSLMTNSRGFYCDTIYKYDQIAPNVNISIFNNCTNSLVTLNNIKFLEYVSVNDFYICPSADEINIDFYYKRYPNKRLVYFHGLINSYYDSLKWELGDKTESYNQELIHEYPAEGVYKVKLKVYISDQILETEKIVSVGDLKDLTGEVYTASSFLPKGFMLAYQLNKDQLLYIDKAKITNGKYKFKNIYNSKYILYAIPDFNLDTNYFPKYLATYYSNTTFWNQAKYIDLQTDNNVDIYLKDNSEIYYGKKSISVKIDKSFYSIYDLIVVNLINSDGDVIDSKYTDINNKSIKFKKLPSDKYFLKLEIAGRNTPKVLVDLVEKDKKNVYFHFSENNISYTTDSYFVKPDVSLKIFPNPSSDYLFFEGNVENKNVKIYSTGGKLVKISNIENNKISIFELTKGVYFMNIITNEGIIYEQKIFIKN